jgi:hypothetical protein
LPIFTGGNNRSDRAEGHGPETTRKFDKLHTFIQHYQEEDNE